LLIKGAFHPWKCVLREKQYFQRIPSQIRRHISCIYLHSGCDKNTATSTIPASNSVFFPM
jgi:hypothetical protein